MKQTNTTQISQQPQFHVIVAGSRHFTDYAKLKAHLDSILSQKLRTHAVTIISGCARGADTLGERYAAERGLATMLFPADWAKYGKSAGPRRNEQMADHADAVVAFWASGSRGTAHMIATARKRKLLLREIKID